VAIICFIDTRVKGDKAMKIKENVVPGWGFIFTIMVSTFLFLQSRQS
jgi:hypothetical protein